MITGLSLLLLTTRLIPFNKSDQEISKTFAGVRYKPVSHFQEFKDGKLHFVTIGDSTRPPLLLIHGSPGSWDVFLEMLTETDLLKSYFVIIPDRPGYNNTTLSAHYTLQQQSKFLEPIVHKYFNTDGIIAGHSYGGSLAMRAGVDFQDKVKGVVVISGTVANPYQNPRWYNYLVKYSPIKYLIHDALAASNREMFQLETDLPKLEEEISGFSKKVALIQGTDDILVDDRSALYLQTQLQNANTKVYLKEGMNHFPIWSDKRLVMETLKWVSDE